MFLKLDSNYFFPTFYQISEKFQAYFLDKVPKCPFWGQNIAILEYRASFGPPGRVKIKNIF